MNWLGFAKRIWAWVYGYAKRYATLEARVAEIERAQGTRPPDQCPYCGERAQRMVEHSGLKGDNPNRYREEDWKCGACGKTEVRYNPVIWK